MKERLNRNRDRLSPDEDRQHWAGLRSALRAERTRELRLHQWRWFDWLIFTGTAVLLTLIIFHSIHRTSEEEWVYIPRPFRLKAAPLEDGHTTCIHAPSPFVWLPNENRWTRREPEPPTLRTPDPVNAEPMATDSPDMVVATWQMIDVHGHRRIAKTQPEHDGVRLPSSACEVVNNLILEEGKLIVRGGRVGEALAPQSGILPHDPLDVQTPYTPCEPTVVIPLVAGRYRPVPFYASGTSGSQPVHDQVTEDNDYPYETITPFVDPKRDPHSAFNLDADTGAYTVARRYLHAGSLPPKDVAQVEAFVNYFKKNYALPWEGDFTVRVDGMPSPFAHASQSAYYLLRIGVRGRTAVAEERRPAQIVFVIDKSGSMAQGNRLEMLKEALGVLLTDLRPDDEVGIVAYDRYADIVRELRPVKDGEELWTQIQSIHPKGTTDASVGIREGYKMMRRWGNEGWNHCIILCTDGVDNVDRTGFAEILEHVHARSDDIALSTVGIGIGMGRYNDTLLEQMANAGDGHYAYIDRPEEAVRFFRENLIGAFELIARDAKAQITFDPDQVEQYRLLGYKNQEVTDRDFCSHTTDAGEVGAGHEVTTLYEVKLRSGCSSTHLADLRLRYQQAGNDFLVELKETIERSALYGALEEAPEDLILDACVAEFAEILQGSDWAKSNTPAAVLDHLYGLSAQTLERSEVAEFVHLVEKASAVYD